MKSTLREGSGSTARKLSRAALFAAGALILPALALAQSSAVVGGLGNFDAANFEGKDAHGLEVQLEGAQVGDLSPSWCGNKYGCPKVIPYATGIYVRYESPYSGGQFTATTVPKTPGINFAGTCYMFTAIYATAGCDHFGVHVNYFALAGRASGPIAMSYRWLFEDPANPGTLIPSSNNLLFVPTPVYTILPPAVPNNPPVLVVEIQTPPPPPPPPAVPPQYGNATWMKVFKTEMNREVFLDELTADNPIVPQTAAQIETEWVLMQPEPPIVESGRRRRNRHTNSGNLNAGVRAVLRRYETYAYTGAYDPTDHHVLCGGDGTCTAPQPGELGDLLVAQMAAANVAVPSITVTLAGNGTVSSSDKVISCGSKCAANYSLNSIVTLTAKAGSNSTFTGWTGACTGAALTCAVTITDSMNVTATFTAAGAGGGGGGGGTGGGGGGSTQFTLQIGRSNAGTVTSDVPGINCGSACSAKFNSGTGVILTATPPAGKTFVSWGGACSGTANTCAVAMTGNLSVQANFSK